jgi:IS605 OrfB family transposase
LARTDQLGKLIDIYREFMQKDYSVKTLKIRVKPKHNKKLCGMAWNVNQVWNYANALSYRSIRERRKWLSAYDIQKYTAGSSKLLNLPSSTIDAICTEYATRRSKAKKARLNWRTIRGSRRNLGWVPFKKASIKLIGDKIRFNNIIVDMFDCGYDLSQYDLRAGNFNQDAQGKWYFNVVVRYSHRKLGNNKAVGIDLGCKEAATDSNGVKIIGREYRKLEKDLAIAQRAKNKVRTRAIHAKIKNKRKDTLHKYSRDLVNQNGFIFVGDVSSSKLVKTKMAKSVLDAGWYMLKTMLSYKCDHAGIVYREVNERYTTQTCSNCGALPDSRPKGIAGLGIREWTCSECGAHHDRDINAAKNIREAGHRLLVEEKRKRDKAA